MFHSFGTSQSKIRVPVGTSVRCSGIHSSTRSRVRRTPLPVMLRQSGYRLRMSGHRAAPESRSGGCGLAAAARMTGGMTYRIEIGIAAIALEDAADRPRPGDAESRVVEAH